jgi:sugar/nucleoside kinase (ribokinase family)
MLRLVPYQPVDYLVIGHLTRDLTPTGPRVGGTAAYSALTARALGLRVGIVTACDDRTSLESLDEIQIAALSCEESTTFKNIYSDGTRQQYIFSIAPPLDYALIPEAWRQTALIHLGPVAQEIIPDTIRHFPNSFIGITPQGWLRTWDEKRQVHPSEWLEARFVLNYGNAAVLSIDDVQGNEDIIAELASSIHVLAITEGYNGARLFWNGDVRRFNAPKVEEVDATGAGDIFAAAFFIRLKHTRNPWEATRFATLLASQSVTRPGLEGIPTADEISTATFEIIEQSMKDHPWE